ncbi:MAG: hypothetical protein A2W22_05385 [Candidatus Levybacteria bacterium RBG_16_35_11]|nr:MAG: hypothetical protein A2W22_05385 [Candidatus Levybacteria bacterium RBG_16_35_11]
MSFTEAFLELFKINSATVILICCGYILFKIHKMDMVLIKTRLFLDQKIIHQSWVYISVAGISIALYLLIKMVSATDIDDASFSYNIIQLIQIIFLIAFTLLVFSWYLFLSDYRLHHTVESRP